MKKKLSISYTYLIGDLFHDGHLNLLKSARKRSDLHICGVISDDAAKSWQEPLICNYKERSNVIKNIKYVDKIMKQSSIDPSENLEKIIKKYPDAKINFYPIHSNWNLMPASKIVLENDGSIIKSTYSTKHSRENIKKIFSTSPYSLNLNNNNLDISKASTLENLSRKLKKSKIEELYYFTLKQWALNKKSIMKKIRRYFKNKIVVVRSSSLSEDRINSSNAGVYHTELDVDVKDNYLLHNAITKVKNSLKKNKYNKDDQIIIQEQSMDVSISGVCLTRNLQNNSPYYIINFDDISKRTDTVTSGLVGKKTEIIKKEQAINIPSEWKNLINSIQEIEKLIPELALDIEFAIDKKGNVIIYQVRPLAANSKFPKIHDEKIFITHSEIGMQYKESISKNTILSDMGFWNPAELIGNRSQPLAISLFNQILMNDVWSKSLQSFGYHTCSKKLSIELGNKLYINVNYAFEGLLPNDLSIAIKNKLIKHYKDVLKKYPEYHDKLEFMIIMSCYNFNTDSRCNSLPRYFKSSEKIKIKNSLKKLTMKLIKNSAKNETNDSTALKKLLKEYHGLPSKYNSWKDLAKSVVVNINLIKKNGTPQFCRAARQAFVSRELFNTFFDQNNNLKQYSEVIFSNIKTVSSEISLRLNNIKSKKDYEKFIKEYGHLRPDTYNINNKRYDQMGSLKTNTSKSYQSKRFSLPKILYTRLSDQLKEIGLDINAYDLLSFLKQSTILREKYKLQYSKVLSDTLEIIAQLGKLFEVSRSDMSYIDYSTIKIISKQDITYQYAKDLITSIVSKRKSNDKKFNQISLPSMIFSKNDLDIIKHHQTSPNFITNKIIDERIVLLDSSKISNLNGKIVLIENADPGYDWIFSYNIKGLVTKYGGVASHMAIRCAEFDIPAAIGCGVLKFDKLKNSKRILLDCKNCNIKSIL